MQGVQSQAHEFAPAASRLTLPATAAAMAAARAARLLLLLYVRLALPNTPSASEAVPLRRTGVTASWLLLRPPALGVVVVLWLCLIADRLADPAVLLAEEGGDTKASQAARPRAAEDAFDLDTGCRAGVGTERGEVWLAVRLEILAGVPLEAPGE